VLSASASGRWPGTRKRSSLLPLYYFTGMACKRVRGCSPDCPRPKVAVPIPKMNENGPRANHDSVEPSAGLPSRRRRPGASGWPTITGAQPASRTLMAGNYGGGGGTDCPALMSATLSSTQE
jgi:hypothetical protein